MSLPSPPEFRHLKHRAGALIVLQNLYEISASGDPLNSLSHIEYFIAAVQLGSFTAAARAQYVTPQTISKAVAELESELSLKLFIRSGGTVRPTPYAHLIASLLEEGLASFQDATAVAHDHPLHAPGEGSLTLLVAASPYRGSAFDAASLAAFECLCPNVRISLDYRSIAACASALERRRADAIFVPGRVPVDGCVNLRIADRPLCLALARANCLAGHRSLRLSDLQGVPVAVPESPAFDLNVLAAAFRNRGVRPSFVRVPPTACAYRTFFEQQEGVAFVVDEPAIERRMPFVVRRPIAAPRQAVLPVCLVYPAGRVNPALSQLAYYLISLNALAHRKKALPG